MAVCEKTPNESAALTVTGNVPSGVPGSGGGPLLPPPPQPTIVVSKTKSRSTRTAPQRRRREEVPNRNRAAKIPPEPVAHRLIGRMLAVFGAVVLIVTTVVPLPTTARGAKIHELSEGRPMHEVATKLMVLLYPV